MFIFIFRKHNTNVLITKLDIFRQNNPDFQLQQIKKQLFVKTTVIVWGINAFKSHHFYLKRQINVTRPS